MKNGNDGSKLETGAHFGWLNSALLPASIKKSPESVSIELCERKNVQSVVSSQQKSVIRLNIKARIVRFSFFISHSAFHSHPKLFRLHGPLENSTALHTNRIIASVI